VCSVPWLASVEPFFCRQARSSWAAGSVFGSQEPVHERVHQLAASRIPYTEVQAGGHDLPAGIQPPDGLAGLMVQDLGPGSGHQIDRACGDRWGHQLEPIKRWGLHRTEALRGAVESRILATPGMRIEVCHSGFEC
jgi:hypothetical protein